MKKIVALAAFTLTGLLAFAQTLEYRKMTLKAKIRDTDGLKTRYFVHSSSDSAIRVMDFDGVVYSDINRSRIQEIKPELIETIGLRRKNQVARGAGLGLIGGVIVGGITGLATYQQPDPNDWIHFGPGVNTLAGAVVGGVLGSITGMIIAIPTKKHRINGSREKFQVFHKALDNRVRRNRKA